MELIMYNVLALLVGWHVPRAALGRRRASLLARGGVFVMAAVAIAFAVTCAATLFHIASDSPPSRKDTLIHLISVIGVSPIWVATSMARRRVIDSSGRPSGDPANHHVESQYGQKLEGLEALPPGPEVPERRARWLSDLDLELNRAAFAIRRESVREGRARRHIDHSSARSAAKSCNVRPWWMAPLAAALLGASAFAAFTAIEFYDDREPGAAFLSLLPIIALHRIWRTAPVLALLRQASRDASLEDVLIRNGVIWYRIR